VICEIWWELFGVATSYTINLVAVAIVSIGCTGRVKRSLTIYSIFISNNGKMLQVLFMYFPIN